MEFVTLVSVFSCLVLTRGFLAAQRTTQNCRRERRESAEIPVPTTGEAAEQIREESEVW